MTVEVAGLWEQGWNTPWAEYDLWDMVVRDFDVARWHMAPVTGIRKEGSDRMLCEHDGLASVLAETGLQVVWVDEAGAETLDAFVHPADALYVMGRTSQRPMPGLVRPQDLSVRIRTARDDGLLWAHQAIAIVLYDRLVKSWL